MIQRRSTGIIFSVSECTARSQGVVLCLQTDKTDGQLTIHYGDVIRGGFQQRRSREEDLSGILIMFFRSAAAQNVRKLLWNLPGTRLFTEEMRICLIKYGNCEILTSLKYFSHSHFYFSLCLMYGFIFF